MATPWNAVRRWIWRILKTAVAALVIAGIVYWVKFAPVPVVAHRVQQGPIVAEVMGTGTLEARVKVTISPKISGRIEQVLADQGDRVQAGDVLVRLDAEELSQQVAIALADVEAARAAVVRLGADKDRSTAVFESAKKAHGRSLTLAERVATSRNEVDKAIEALGVAEAGVARAEAAISEGQEELTSAEKKLEYQRARLKDTEIRALFDGLIVRRRRDPGDVVVPGSSILTLISTGQLWISAWVDETEMAKLRDDQPARVVFRSEPDRSYPGKVTRLGREADRETREFVVDVHVLGLPANWAVGQRAEAYIETDRQSMATLLPAEFVVRRDGEAGVFVDVDGCARWRAISEGLRSRKNLEIADGLQPDETVVLPVDAKTILSDGRRIVRP